MISLELMQSDFKLFKREADIDYNHSILDLLSKEIGSNISFCGEINISSIDSFGGCPTKSVPSLSTSSSTNSIYSYDTTKPGDSDIYLHKNHSKVGGDVKGELYFGIKYYSKYPQIEKLSRFISGPGLDKMVITGLYFQEQKQ
ncbi:hypothetical protein ACTFIW_005473 [Dictyostelium discoideum]